MKFTTLGLSALAVICSTAPVLAKDQYWYVGAKGGYVWDRNDKFNFYGTTNPSFQLNKDHGYAITGQVGYDFGLIRVELDSGYSRNDIRSAGITNVSGPFIPGSYPADGAVRVWSSLGDVLFDVINTDRFTVSGGGGFGFVRVNQRNVSVSTGGPLINQSENNYAWQLIGGARFALTDRLDLTADYRYFQTADIEFQTIYGDDVKAKHKSHTALLGFAYNFGGTKKAVVSDPTPPPPPPPLPAPTPEPQPAAPPPPPATPGPVMVFFDFASSILSVEGKSVLEKELAPLQSGNSTTIEVNGYADRAGSDGFNIKLGQKRAVAVESYLVSHGIAKSRFSIKSFGETHNLVETADGVREPQNRRVEIIISPQR